MDGGTHCWICLIVVEGYTRLSPLEEFLATPLDIHKLEGKFLIRGKGEFKILFFDGRHL
jgi:hypothetical protein